MDAEMCRTKVILLLIISVVSLLVGIAFLILANTVGKNRFSSRGKLCAFTAMLFGAIWSLRYAVGLSGCTGDGLTWFEEIWNSMIHTLQTFSMDEQYAEYIHYGKDMMRKLFGEGTLKPAVCGLYSSILNIAAPIAGGTLIFDILTSFFPKLKLMLGNALFWKEKYIFSELNDRSLALSKSIIEEKGNWLNKPIIVFTDCYIDADKENESERLLSAKRCGAICVNDDVTHRFRSIRRSKACFVLIDDDEQNNLRSLSVLTDEKHWEKILKTRIFIFCQSELDVIVEKKIFEDLQYRVLEKYGNGNMNFGDEDSKKLFAQYMPDLKTVKGYQNIVYNLLSHYPLFEPIIGTNRKNLNVTVIGSGFIGTQMFLSTTWCGQMIDCALSINVVSDEPWADFKKKIDYINSEIIESTIPENPLLRVYPNKDIFAEPYYTLRYCMTDVKTYDLSSIVCEDMLFDEKPAIFRDEHSAERQQLIIDSDYIVVAIGSDEDNILIAHRMKDMLRHVNCINHRNIMIAYVVYDKSMCDTLNGSEGHTIEDGICMRAFGSIDEIYSWETVTMQEYIESTEYTASAYNMARGIAPEIRWSYLQDNYQYWANIGRNAHFLYKMYSAGFVEESVFNGCSIQEIDRLRIEQANKFSIMAKNQPDILNKRLMRLEHRRWNAFMRTIGYKNPNSDEIAAFCTFKNSWTKNLEMKLHPCIVECDEFGDRVYNGTDKKSAIAASSFDMLDNVAYQMGYDVKKFDYPYYKGKYNDGVFTYLANHTRNDV